MTRASTPFNLIGKKDVGSRVKPGHGVEVKRNGDTPLAAAGTGAAPSYIAEAHARIVRAHLSASAQVWIFGSRATGRARRYSDLAIDAGRRLTFDEAAVLREAFEESDLPYRVDIVDWRAIDERFRRLIEARRVALAE